MRKKVFLPVGRKRVTNDIQCKTNKPIYLKSDRNFKIEKTNSSNMLFESKILTLPKISAFEVSLANTKIMQPRHSIKAISQSMVPNDFLLMNLFMTITGNTLAPPSAIVTVTNDSNFK